MPFKNPKLNDWECWSVHVLYTCPQSSGNFQLSLLWISQYCLAGSWWQLSMEIYSPPGKGNFQMKRHLWDKGVLENIGKSTIWSKFCVTRLSEKLLHVQLCLLICFSGEGCGHRLDAKLLASTFCFPDSSSPKGLSTKWPNATKTV